MDTATRSAVVNSYLNVFSPSTAVPTGWTGNVTAGNAGSTTQAYQNAVLLRVNWFRQMAGIASPVTFSATYNSENQQAALMMSANGQLSQTPTSDWAFFSTTGAEGAAHSNLCLEIPYLPDPGCIAFYMQDYGSTNPAVGHRRWLLYPQTQVMGIGDVQPPYPTPFASALWVLDSHFYDSRPATRDPFIAWPPKGFIPYQLVPGRWSFSYPGADFTNATVSMQRGGSTVALRLETPQQGFGESSLVWVPDNLDTAVSTSWPRPVIDTPIAVTVSNVRVSGSLATFTYTVTVIDPGSSVTISGHVTNGSTALGGVSVSLSGSASATTDGTGAYAIGPVVPGTYLVTPSLAGYAFSPSSRVYSTSTTTADFAAFSCDYSALGGNVTANPLGGTDIYAHTLTPGCPWTATSNASWLALNPASGAGTGAVSVTYTYPANRGLARTAALTVGGRTLNVSQASAGQSLAGPVSPGVFLNGRWVMDTNGSGVFDAGDRYFTFQILGAGDTPVIGDWSGDGHVKTGVYRAGFWALDNNGSGFWDGVPTDKFYAFGGNVGEVPIVGDWNGDGRSKIGYYLNGFWALDYNGNGQWDGPVIDRFFAYGGRPGEIPVLGDWNGDGRTKIGSYLNGSWLIDYNGNGLWDGVVVDRYVTYTLGTGDKPVVGNWTGTGGTKIGVYKNGFWLLDSNGDYVNQSSDQFLAFGGNTSEVPVVGDWNGDGRSKVGYFLNGFWALDYNGNGHWDAGDRFSALGGNPGEKPVPGKW